MRSNVELVVEYEPRLVEEATLLALRGAGGSVPRLARRVVRAARPGADDRAGPRRADVGRARRPRVRGGVRRFSPPPRGPPLPPPAGGGDEGVRSALRR